MLPIMESCKKNIQDPVPFAISTPIPIITKPMGDTSLTISMGGNSFVTNLGSNNSEIITENMLTNWTNVNCIVSAYFRIGNTGTLKVKMKASVPDGQSNVKVTIDGIAFNVALSGSANNIYDVGTTNVTKTGYIKVTFQGVSKTGTYFANVSDLIISGSVVASNVQFANDSVNYYWSRRGPSVHLFYTTPSNSQWFYNEVMVPVNQDPIGSYFMANGFNEGYFGMQVNSATERRILFSVWNPAAGITTSSRAGSGVVVKTFSGEGSGGQSYLSFNWVAGNKYKFLTKAMPDAGGNTTFSSWFYAPEVGAWKFIASWLRPSTKTYLSGLYSFLENFLDTNGYLNRRANYGNQWICDTSGTWVEVTSAFFDGDDTAVKKQRMDYAGGVTGNQFYLENGGFFNDFTLLNQTFIRTAAGIPPVINFALLP